jgi:hypothetical protein
MWLEFTLVTIDLLRTLAIIALLHSYVRDSVCTTMSGNAHEDYCSLRGVLTVCRPGCLYMKPLSML